MDDEYDINSLQDATVPFSAKTAQPTSSIAPTTMDDGEEYDISSLQPATSPDGIPEITITAPRLNAPAPVEGAPRESALDFLKTTAYNVPGSAANLVGGLVNVAMHPIQTAGTIGMAAGGGAQNIYNIVADTIGLPKAEVVDPTIANQIGQMFVDRYGSGENILNTIKTDPVGFVADASAVLTGGGSMASSLGKVGSMTAKVGEAASKVGSAIDPLTAMGNIAKPTIGALGNVAAAPFKLAKSAFPMITGVDKEVLQSAYQFGEQGGDVNKIFNAAKEGKIPAEQVVSTVEKNIPDYTPTGTDALKIDVNPIRQDLDNYFENNFVPLEKQDKYKATVDAIQNVNSPQQLEMIKNDLIKQRSGYVQYSADARSLDALISSIDTNIAKQAPGYAEHVKNKGELNAALSETKVNPTSENIDKLASTYKKLVPEIDIEGAIKAGRETSATRSPDSSMRTIGSALSGIGGAIVGGSPMHGLASLAASQVMQSPRLAGTVANVAGGAVGKTKSFVEPAIKLSDLAARNVAAAAQSPAGNFIGSFKPAVPSALRIASGAQYLPQQQAQSSEGYIGRVAPTQ